MPKKRPAMQPDPEPDDWFVYLAKNAYRKVVGVFLGIGKRRREKQTRRLAEKALRIKRAAQEAKIKSDLEAERRRNAPIVFKPFTELSAEPDPDEPIRCPRCGSSQLSANKQGFRFGRGIVGALLVGPVGLAAGLRGASDVKITCLKCAHVFDPGEGQ